MSEIRLIKQIYPETATPWGLHISEGNKFELLPGAYGTENEARAARSDQQIRRVAEELEVAQRQAEEQRKKWRTSNAYR